MPRRRARRTAAERPRRARRCSMRRSSRARTCRLCFRCGIPRGVASRTAWHPVELLQAGRRRCKQVLGGGGAYCGLTRRRSVSLAGASGEGAGATSLPRCVVRALAAAARVLEEGRVPACLPATGNGAGHTVPINGCAIGCFVFARSSPIVTAVPVGAQLVATAPATLLTRGTPPFDGRFAPARKRQAQIGGTAGCMSMSVADWNCQPTPTHRPLWLQCTRRTSARPRPAGACKCGSKHCWCGRLRTT